jgi:hypothetical protein
MKHIHMKKPDIKGFFQKIRNLKMQDIKEHFKERKERRRKSVAMENSHVKCSRCTG